MENRAVDANASSLYFSNKAKWQQSKAQISKYQIDQYSSGYPGWTETSVVVDVARDAAISCQSFTGIWGNPSPPVTSDCLGTSVADLRVESFFSQLENLIISGNAQNLGFDKEFGVPTKAYGASLNPQCADCGTPGFSITFKAL